MKFYVIPEIAEILRISESLAYQLVENGKIVPHRFGNGRGKITVSEADLEAYIESCRVEKQERKPAPPRPRLKHLRL